jgi:hypothetical protein
MHYSTHFSSRAHSIVFFYLLKSSMPETSGTTHTGLFPASTGPAYTFPLTQDPASTRPHTWQWSGRATLEPLDSGFYKFPVLCFGTRDRRCKVSVCRSCHHRWSHNDFPGHEATTMLPAIAGHCGPLRAHCGNERQPIQAFVSLPNSLKIVSYLRDLLPL